MKQFSDYLFKACFKQMCFNLRPQQYTDNNFFENSVLNLSSDIVRQCSLQIYIKQAMITSKLYTKFCSSVINACHLLFVWSFKMAKISLVEVVLHCAVSLFPTHVYIYSDNEDDHESANIGNLV